MEKDKTRQRALNNAYALLRSRPRSEYEIRSRLMLKAYASDVIEYVVGELQRHGEIDDARFARLWVESKMYSNPAGDIVLRQELKSRGVADGTIEAALAEKAKNYDEYAIALNMAEERFERLKKLDRRKATKRLYDFLVRRGFGYETAQKIIESLSR